MIIKKYIANTFEDAELHMRRELGPKAIMLNTRYIPQKGWRSLFTSNKVEITAAIEESDLDVHNQEKLGEASAKQTPEKEVAQLTDTLEGLKQFVANAEAPKKEVVKEEVSATPATAMAKTETSAATYGNPRYRQAPVASTSKPVTQTSVASESGDNLQLSSAYSAVHSKTQQTVTTTKAVGGDEVTTPTSTTATMEKEDQTDLELAKRKLAALRSIRYTEKTKEEPKAVVRNEVSISASMAAEPQNDVMKLSKGLIDRFGATTEEPVSTTTPTSQAGTTAKGLSLDDLRQVIRDEMKANKVASASNTASATPASEADNGCMKFLLSKGVDVEIASTIATTLEKEFQGVSLSVASPQRTALMNGMKRELAKSVTTTGPIFLKRGEPTLVALVGPTGVGKTSTLMKIASQYVQGLGKKVAVVSVDNKKIGAREQIKELTSKLGIALDVASNKEELHVSIQKLSDHDLILIDTSGCSQYEPVHISELSHLLSSVRGVKTLLTMSATTKDVDAYGIVKKFSGINIDSLVFTKLDETIADGLIVNVCNKTGRAVRYLTTGQRIPGDLKIAESDEIAKAIMVQHNEQEYDAIRHLVGRR